jgi:hypothetical protein
LTDLSHEAGHILGKELQEIANRRFTDFQTLDDAKERLATEVGFLLRKIVELKNKT